MRYKAYKIKPQTNGYAEYDQVCDIDAGPFTPGAAFCYRDGGLGLAISSRVSSSVYKSDAIFQVGRVVGGVFQTQARTTGCFSWGSACLPDDSVVSCMNNYDDAGNYSGDTLYLFRGSNSFLLSGNRTDSPPYYSNSKSIRGSGTATRFNGLTAISCSFNGKILVGESNYSAVTNTQKAKILSVETDGSTSNVFSFPELDGYAAFDWPIPAVGEAGEVYVLNANGTAPSWSGTSKIYKLVNGYLEHVVDIPSAPFPYDYPIQIGMRVLRDGSLSICEEVDCTTVYGYHRIHRIWNLRGTALSLVWQARAPIWNSDAQMSHTTSSYYGDYYFVTRTS